MWILLVMRAVPARAVSSSNEYFRKLSKSKSKLGILESNREWFNRSVEGGYHRCNLYGDRLDFYFYFKLKPEVSVPSFVRILRLRAKKIYFCDLEVTILEESVVLPLTAPQFFRAFGSFYGKVVAGPSIEVPHPPIESE
jgi:hypothetical protein